MKVISISWAYSRLELTQYKVVIVAIKEIFLCFYIISHNLFLLFGFKTNFKIIPLEFWIHEPMLKIHTYDIQCLILSMMCNPSYEVVIYSNNSLKIRHFLALWGTCSKMTQWMTLWLNTIKLVQLIVSFYNKESNSARELRFHTHTSKTGS